MKTRIVNYTFDKSVGQIIFTDYVGPGIDLDGVLFVSNVTRSVLMYNFLNSALTATVSGNVLDLAYDTSAQDDDDELLIYYDDPARTTATEEKQTAGNASLTSIDGKITAVDTGDVVISASALPSGAATEANQATEITGLAAIASNTADVATQTTLALIKAKTDNLDTSLSGIKTGTDKIIAAPATEANQTSELTKLDTLHTDLGVVDGDLDAANVSLASIDTKIPALGQALAAASVPVILPAATITTLTPQTNALTDTQLRAVAVPVSAAALPLPSGASTETTLGTRLSESDFDTKIGSLTETAPATDTASSGANGRLQRVAQNITTMIAKLPGSLGQKAMAASLAVVIASDQVSIPVASTLQAGSAVVGKVTIDQTTPGTTDSVSIATAQGAGATIGVTTGAAVITDANGTLQQYLRGIVKLIIAKIGVTIADGDSATMGVTTGAAVVTDTTGTLQQYLRGVIKIFADIWDSTNHWFKVRSFQYDTYANAAALTITLNSLASSTAGVGRQSTLLTGNTNRAAIVNVKLKMGTTPTINTVCDVYLLMGDGTIATDSAGASDAGITISNAKLLGRLSCISASAGLILADAFDTRLVTPALGPQWGIAIVNSSGAALDASAGGTIDYTLVS